MDEKENKKKKFSENKTKYGEFISSFFGWIPIDEQKKRADELNNITKNKDE